MRNTDVPISLYPLVLYAKKIGKNTAELTATDFSRFMKEWIKQQPRKDLLNMGRKITSKKVTNMPTKVMNGTKSRMVAQAPIEEPEEIEQDQLGEEEGVEMMSDEETAQMNEEEVAGDEIVADIPLTQLQIDALAWGLGELLATLDFSQMPEIGETLQGLYDDLEPEATKGV